MLLFSSFLQVIFSTFVHLSIYVYFKTFLPFLPFFLPYFLSFFCTFSFLLYLSTFLPPIFSHQVTVFLYLPSFPSFLPFFFLTSFHFFVLFSSLLLCLPSFLRYSHTKPQFSFLPSLLSFLASSLLSASHPVTSFLADVSCHATHPSLSSPTTRSPHSHPCSPHSPSLPPLLLTLPSSPGTHFEFTCSVQRVGTRIFLFLHISRAFVFNASVGVSRRENEFYMGSLCGDENAQYPLDDKWKGWDETLSTQQASVNPLSLTELVGHFYIFIWEKIS